MKDQAVLAMRMFIEAHRLNPPSRLLCSEAQSEGGGEADNREMGGVSDGTRLSELNTVTSLCLILSRHPQGVQTPWCISTRRTYELSSITTPSNGYKNVAHFLRGREPLPT